MRTCLILILLPLSFALWNCGGESQTSGESTADVTNDPTNKYIQLYDSLYPDDEFLVRKYVPVDAKLVDYLPIKIPHVIEGKMYEYPKELLRYAYESPNFFCFEPNNRNRFKERAHGCFANREYDFYKEHSRVVRLTIGVHNNSVSVEKYLYHPEFFDPEKQKLLPSYKGYKYTLNVRKNEYLTTSTTSLFVPPFIIIDIEFTYNRAYPYEAPPEDDAYFTKNWQKILDEIDLKKLNETYNIEGGKFKGRNL